MKKKILFICTHNSARSQMAEGLINHFFKDNYIAHSAGTKPSNVNPFAVRVMKEKGIDISEHTSKHVNTFKNHSFDYVVTVCDSAKEECPFFPGAKEYIHKSFPDPSSYEGNEDEKLEFFRYIRDEIFKWLKNTFK